MYQLHGGIIKYGIEEDGKDFNGKCYVFDNRIVKDINNINPNIIGECYVTGKKSDRMVNCANAECNKHIPLSDDGDKFIMDVVLISVQNQIKSENLMEQVFIKKN